MHFSPVWSAVRATLAKLPSQCFWWALRLLPLLAILVPAGPREQDCFITAGLCGLCLSALLLLFLKEPLGRHFVLSLCRLDVWLKLATTALVLKLILLTAVFGQGAETGALIQGVGRLVVNENAHYSILLFVVLLLCQRKTRNLTALIAQSCARFELDQFYSLLLVLDSKKLPAEEYQTERRRLEDRRRAQSEVGGLGDLLFSEAGIANAALILCVAVASIVSKLQRLASFLGNLCAGGTRGYDNLFSDQSGLGVLAGDVFEGERAMLSP